MDPVIGNFVASALAMAGEAIVKGVAELGVNDAYSALKAEVARWASGDVAALESNPRSEARQAVIAETVAGLSDDEQKELFTLAQALSAKLKAVREKIGLDISRLAALELKIGNVTIEDGVGVRLQDATVSGGVTFGDVSVQSTRGKG